MKIHHICLAALGAALILGTAGCPGGAPCDPGQSRQKVGYDANLEIRRIPLEPRSFYCEVSRGPDVVWAKMRSSRLDYMYDATYLGPPEVDSAGQKSYSVEAQSLVERTSRSYDMWLDCGPSERDDTPGVEKPMIQYLDLNAAQQITTSSYRIPVISWSENGHTSVGEGLSPYETRGSRNLPFSDKSYSVCVSSGALGGTLLVKDYVPLFECRSEPPPEPSLPAAPVACDPPAPPAMVKTCSGEDTQNPMLFMVGVVDTASGCGMSIQAIASSEEEAKTCVGSISGVTIADELCYYSVRIYTDPSDFVTMFADSQEHAIECAKNTECSGDYGDCSLDQVVEESCTSY